MEEVHAILTKIVDPDPKAFELTLDLVRSRIATNGPFRNLDLIVAVDVPIFAPPRLVLARGVRFAARLEPRGVELCSAAARFGTLTPHVEALADETARGWGEVGRDCTRMVFFDVIVRSRRQWRGLSWRRGVSRR
jgi:hypothetical protein